MQAMYASFSQLAKDGDVATHVATYYAPSAKYHPVEEAAPIRGTVELVRWHERWFDAWDELQARAEEVLAHEEMVVAAVSVRARPTASRTSASTFSSDCARGSSTGYERTMNRRRRRAGRG